MAFEPEALDYEFVARLTTNDDIGGWTIITMPDSKEFFGTGKSVKVEATIDGEPLTSSFMPDGKGAHLMGIKAAVRTTIGKQAGDDVTVRLIRRLS